jgi:hypothetical protein
LALRARVAIGLSSGFFEPLEATGIVFAEVAAVMLATLFPWGGDRRAAEDDVGRRKVSDRRGDAAGRGS